MASRYDNPIDLNGASVDQAITMNLNFGFLASGQSVTKTFYTSLNGSGAANDMPIGTNGDDTIDAGFGDDIILGLDGNDTLIGGAGDDLFIFAEGNGQDVIQDFTAGAGTDDAIDLSAIGTVSNLADLLDNSSVVGSDLNIDLGGGDQLTLIGVNASDLHEDDFLF